MSSNVNEILGAITAASDALAREPQLKSQIYALENDLRVSQETVQSRELAIVDYKHQIEELANRNRSLEVERDHAQFRTLELEETISAATDMFKGIGVNLQAGLALIDPPKPLPPVEEPVALPVAGDPTQDTSMYGGAPAEQVPASPPSAPYAPPVDIVAGSGLAETDGRPKGPYDGRKWSEAKSEMNNRWNVTEWTDGGGSLENWNL